MDGQAWIFPLLITFGIVKFLFAEISGSSLCWKWLFEKVKLKIKELFSKFDVNISQIFDAILTFCRLFYFFIFC